jgi:hypothetical protein
MHGLNAQSLARETMCSMGGGFSGSSVYLSQTIGQPSSISVEDCGSFTLLQGFQQQKHNTYIYSSFKNDSVTIYPIPFRDQFFIRFSKQREYQVLVSSSGGEIVDLFFVDHLNEVAYDASLLLNGVYLVSVFFQSELVDSQVIIKSK